MKRSGRKSAAQTPAPKSERIYGSSKNPKGSAKSKTSASKIKVSQEISETLSEKVKKYNESHPKNKVSLATLKAVFRRGAGAYSRTHRPTITGGAPNSRTAWAYARVNKFLEKKSGKPVKKAYVQDDDLLKDGGITNQNVVCHRCGWMWSTNDSSPSDKYVCHKCGFDNSWYYGDRASLQKKNEQSEITQNYKSQSIQDMLDADFKRYGNMNKINLPDTESTFDNLEPILAKQGYELKKAMKPTHSVQEIAHKFKVSEDEVQKQIEIGTQHETEHYYSKELAKNTALHHIWEDLMYYPRLKKMEMAAEAEKLQGYYLNGGNVIGGYDCQLLDEQGERRTDEEAIDRLTECLKTLPQTKTLHFDLESNDYKPYRKRLHRDIIYDLKKDLYCVDRSQPIAILMGGSPASGKSTFLRKYAPYLLKEEIFKIDADEIRAKLPEYKGYNAAQTHLETKDIVTTLLSDRNIGIPCRFDVIYDGTMNNTKSYLPLINLLKKDGYKVFIVYIDKVPKDVVIKRSLERYKRSGRFVPLEVIDDFFSKGKTALEQLKQEVDGYLIVDGSNTDYKIIERGGKSLPKDRNYSKIGEPIQITEQEVVRELQKGGELDPDDKEVKDIMTHKSGAAGGLLVGNRHSEGGIKAVNKSTNQPLEMEGGEVVITRDAVSDDTKREFEGEMLTNREILSRINESGGGVSFAKGGNVPAKCACSGKSYKFGGKMMKDNDIVTHINDYHRKNVGMKYADMPPSEAYKKLFRTDLMYGNGGIYEDGGKVYGEEDLVIIINKAYPSFNVFRKKNDNIQPQAMKRAYKQFLKKQYDLNFDELPHMIQAALLMGNQKLADTYINS